MPWKIASILFLTISVASVGFFMEESLKMRDCKVEVIDFKPEEKTLKLRITNPTLFPLKVKKIENYRDVSIANSETLGCFKGELIIQPGSSTEAYIPVNQPERGIKLQIRGVVYATGIFGEAEIPFSTGKLNF